MTDHIHSGGDTKRCPRCEEVKPTSAFSKHSRYKDGLQSWCKGCMADKKREKTYGLSIADFRQMLEEQNHKCDICHTEIDEHSCRVDHCHSGGHVRGLLCHNCNVGLGHFRDDPAMLQRAIAYLER